MIKIRDNFKYLVVYTGYTARLIEGGACMKIEEEIKERLDAQCEKTYDKESGGYLEVDCDHCKDRILYIRDKIWGKKEFHDVWGEGMKVISGSTEEIKHIKDSLIDLDEEKYGRGMIAFRCSCVMDATSIIDVLMKQNYCAFFKWTEMGEIVISDDVLVFTFGCESG